MRAQGKEKKGTADYLSKVYELTRRIPYGRVATYGDIAAACGLKSSRMVGWALNGVKDPSIPCHRVVNRLGELTGKAYFGGDLMEELLKNEGVEFDDNGNVLMDKYRWKPDTAENAE